MCRHDGIEVDELEHPIRIHERRIVADTEGPGEFRGAPGVRVEFGPIDGCRMKVHYTADGMVNVAQGARGGLPGGPVQAFRRKADGRLEPQPACAGVELQPGQNIVSVSSGGGGYGAPWKRDPQRVAHDVREGWVSRERAREVYGVALDEAGAVAEDATRALRARLAEAR